MNLTQQLEDKKKGCGTMITIGLEYSHCGFRNTFFCDNCKSEIAILEQAIAEIKKRDKDIDELAESSTFALCALIKENKELKDEMQKQRQEILDWIKEHEFTQNQGGYLIYADDLETYIQQLNQPKTEEVTNELSRYI